MRRYADREHLAGLPGVRGSGETLFQQMTSLAHRQDFPEAHSAKRPLAQTRSRQISVSADITDAGYAVLQALRYPNTHSLDN
jgi:hypothetical protein